MDGLPGCGAMSSISKYKASLIRGPRLNSSLPLRGVDPTGMCHEPSMKMFLERMPFWLLCLWASIAWGIVTRLFVADSMVDVNDG